MSAGSTGFDHLDRDWLAHRPGAKWHRHGPDVLPAWVADMDFPTPPPVVAALHELIDAGDLGYPDWPEGSPLRGAFADRMATRFGWNVDPADVREMTDVVQGVQVAIDLVSVPGDAVVVQTPAYPPFFPSVIDLGRRLVVDPLVDAGDGYRIDAEALTASVVAERPRVFVLCNPQNPTGRCFGADELRVVADLALEHDMVVIADEIHADLTYPPNRHIPFASLGADVAASTITVTSATKAFNLAATRCAVMHVGDPATLAALDGRGHLHGGVSTMGVAASLAAWEHGDDWLAGLLDRLDHNRRHFAERVADRLPGLGYHVPEATYLAWLDLRSAGLGDDPAAELLRRARVALSSGPEFGAGGAGFARANLATTPELLDEIVERMTAAIGAGS